MKSKLRNLKIRKIIFDPMVLIKIATALYVIGTSIYDIAQDVTKIRKEHGLLIIGLLTLVKTIADLYKEVKALPEEIKETDATV